MMTRDEVGELLKAHMKIDANNWKNTTRYLYIYHETLGFSRRVMNNLGHSLLGGLGDADSFEIIDPNTIEFKDVSYIGSGRSRRGYEVTDTVTKIGNKIIFKTELEYLYVMVMENFSEFMSTPLFKDTIERMGEGNHTNEDIAKYMSIQEREYELDEPDPIAAEWSARIDVQKLNGMYRVEGILEDEKGEPVFAQKNLWSVKPSGDISGIPGSRKAAGEDFGGRSWFMVTTDLRKREVGTVQIMNPKDVKIKLFCWAKNSDDKLVKYEATITVDMSDILPVYDYFLNLA